MHRKKKIAIQSSVKDEVAHQQSPVPCEGSRLMLKLLFQLTGKMGTCEVLAGIQPNAKLYGITQSVRL